MKEFKRMVATDQLIGIREYLGQFYGYYWGDFDLAQRSEIDLILDTSNINIAMELKHEFPDYVKVVSLEYNPACIVHHLVQRYDNMTLYNKAYLEYLKMSKEMRLEDTVKKKKDNDRMISVADYVLEDVRYPFKHRNLRNYILVCRRKRIV